MHLRLVPDPLLRQRAREVTDFDGALAAQIATMSEIMVNSAGLGLAGPQAGLDRRVVVAFVDGNLTVVVNPVVAEQSGSWTFDEGCLSLPGLFLPVRRARRAVITGLDANGSPVTIDDDAMLARVLLHEIDHLDGILMTDRADVALVR